MTTPRVALFLVALVLIPGGTLPAIPANIGGNFNVGMGNDDHVPMEEWFRSGSHWLPGAALPGAWVADPADLSQFTLDLPGYVFGLAAAKGIVLRDNTGAIREVRAVFDEKTSGKRPSDLVAALKKNIAAFTGSAAVQTTPGTFLFTSATLNVRMSVGKNGATVSLTPCGGKA